MPKDASKPQLTTFIFIDAANIIYGAKETGRWKVDFHKLFKYLTERFKAKKVFYYTGFNPKNKKQLKKLHELQKIGFVVKAKPIKFIHQNPVKKTFACPKCKFKWAKTINRPPRIKSNCDVDLTIDAIKFIDQYQRGIFLTGDGDFIPIFNLLLANNKNLKIIGAVKRTAIDIRKTFKSLFIDLDQIKQIIRK